MSVTPDKAWSSQQSVNWDVGPPVCLLSVGLFFRKFLFKRRWGASLSTDPTVTSWAVVSRGSAPSCSACSSGVRGISVLFQGLQLSQGDDVTALGPVPHCALGGSIVIIEPWGVGVKQLPPLVLPRPLDANALWRVPHTLACQQVSVHTLPRSWLNNLHPLQPAEREERWC